MTNLSSNKIKVSDPELEYKKYVKAKNAALVELGELYDRARLSVGEGDAQIFVIHQMLITDEQYDSSIRTKILDEHFNADYAVASTSRSFAEMLAQMDSEYMQSRAADVKDVSNRLLRHILNCADKLPILRENAIICTGRPHALRNPAHGQGEDKGLLHKVRFCELSYCDTCEKSWHTCHCERWNGAF